MKLRSSIIILLLAAIAYMLVGGIRTLFLYSFGLDPWSGPALAFLYDRAAGGDVAGILPELSFLAVWLIMGILVLVWHRPLAFAIASGVKRLIPDRKPARPPVVLPAPERAPGRAAVDKPAPAAGVEAAAPTSKPPMDAEDEREAARARIEEAGQVPEARNPPAPVDPADMPPPAAIPNGAALALLSKRFTEVVGPVTVTIPSTEDETYDIEVSAIAVDGDRLVLAFLSRGSGIYQLSRSGYIYRTDSASLLDWDEIGGPDVPGFNAMDDAFIVVERLKKQYGLTGVSKEAVERGPITLGGRTVTVEAYAIVNRETRLHQPELILGNIADLEGVLALVSDQDHPGLSRFFDLVGEAARVDPVSDRDLTTLALQALCELGTQAPVAA